MASSRHALVGWLRQSSSPAASTRTAPGHQTFRCTCLHSLHSTLRSCMLIAPQQGLGLNSHAQTYYQLSRLQPFVLSTTGKLCAVYT